MDSILIIVAHSDDEALGCGGTIARHVAEGDHVEIIYMADGVSSRTENDSSISDRQAASIQAQKLLGISKAHSLELPDNKMDTLALLDIVQKLEPIIQETKPEIIYTHHYGDLNIDHKITHQAVLTACRPQPNSTVKQIYSFEVMSSTEWSAPQDNPFLPNYFVDISPYLEKKIAAIQAYSDEMRTTPHSRSIEHCQSLAHHRGSSIGVHAAEAFTLIRHIK